MTAGTDDAAALDLAPLDALRSALGPAVAGLLLAKFLDGAAVRLAALDATYPPDALETAGRAAHSLRTTARQFGAAALGQLAGEYERAADEGRADALPPLAVRMHAALDAFARALESRALLPRTPDGAAT